MNKGRKEGDEKSENRVTDQDGVRAEKKKLGEREQESRENGEKGGLTVKQRRGRGRKSNLKRVRSNRKRE